MPRVYHWHVTAWTSFNESCWRALPMRCIQAATRWLQAAENNTRPLSKLFHHSAQMAAMEACSYRRNSMPTNIDPIVLQSWISTLLVSYRSPITLAHILVFYQVRELAMIRSTKRASTLSIVFCTALVIPILSTPAAAQGLGVGAGVGGIGASAGIGGGGVGASAGVGGVGASAGIGGGGVGASAGVGGVGAGVGAGIGGGGVGAGVGAGVGGVGVGAGVGAGTGGVSAGVGAGLGSTGVNVGIGLFGGLFGGGTGTGTNTGTNNGSTSRSLSSGVRSFRSASYSRKQRLRRRCRSIIAHPSGYDRDLVRLCRLIRR